jgi:hypothetical protein
VQTPAKPGIDYQVLLLAMADEYLNAAHGQGTTVALLRREMELEEYYRLVATGLGCLEAVLKVRRSPNAVSTRQTLNRVA